MRRNRRNDMNENDDDDKEDVNGNRLVFYFDSTSIYNSRLIESGTCILQHVAVIYLSPSSCCRCRESM
jgi:hypothetical protein